MATPCAAAWHDKTRDSSLGRKRRVFCIFARERETETETETDRRARAWEGKARCVSGKTVSLSVAWPPLSQRAANISGMSAFTGSCRKRRPWSQWSGLRSPAARCAQFAARRASLLPRSSEASALSLSLVQLPSRGSEESRKVEEDALGVVARGRRSSSSRSSPRCRLGSEISVGFEGRAGARVVTDSDDAF